MRASWAAVLRAVARSSPLLLLALFAGGCASAPARGARPGTPAHEPSAVDACALLPAPNTSADTVSIAVAKDVDPSHALNPRDDGERLLFAQLYETLVRVDCAGRVRPALAKAWSSDASGRRWTFTLRNGARFWSGDPMIARDVVESWRTRGASGAGGFAPESPLVSIVESAAVLDDTTLVVTLPNSSESPLLLARPELAVWRSVETSSWPLGTSRYRVSAAESRVASPNTVPPGGDSSDPGAVIALRSADTVDGRDLLDGGVDVMVTDDPSVLAYAATKPDLVSLPLPWDRTYVLLVPSRARARRGSPADSAAQGATSAEWTSFRAALARDAVRVEARGAEAPFWWEGAGACDVGALVPLDSQAPARRASRIVYARGDRTARDIAERLVALAAFEHGDDHGGTLLTSVVPEAADAGARLRAAALAPTEFDAALSVGDELAYVVALPRRALVPCQELRSLAAVAPWLVPKPAARVAAEDLDLAHVLVPLVDTRSRVIVRRGVVGIVADRDGTLHFRDASLVPSGATP